MDYEFVLTAITVDIVDNINDILNKFIVDNPTKWKRALDVTRMNKINIPADDIERLVKEDIVEKVKRNILPELDFNYPVVSLSMVQKQISNHVEKYNEIYTDNMKCIIVDQPPNFLQGYQWVY